MVARRKLIRLTLPRYVVRIRKHRGNSLSVFRVLLNSNWLLEELSGSGEAGIQGRKGSQYKFSEEETGSPAHVGGR